MTKIFLLHCSQNLVKTLSLYWPLYTWVRIEYGSNENSNENIVNFGTTFIFKTIIRKYTVHSVLNVKV